MIDSGKREKTIVQVELPKAGNLVIQVFTLDGNVVRVLERGLKGGGTYSVITSYSIHYTKLYEGP